jgi:hypothetical protein
MGQISIELIKVRADSDLNGMAERQYLLSSFKQ